MKKSIIDKMIEKETNFEADYSKISDKIDVCAKSKLRVNKESLYSIFATSICLVIAVFLIIFMQKPSYEKDLIMNRANNPYTSTLHDEKYEPFARAISGFELDFASSYIKKYGVGKNEVCSPATLVNTLSLAIEVSNDNVREEILNSFGLDYETFYKYINSYINDFKSYRIKGTSLELSNSIWIDNNLDVLDNCINRLSNTYETSSFYLDFNNVSKSKSKIKEYIKDSTKNNLNVTPQIDANTLCVLMSVLYLKDMWKFDGSSINKTGDFTFTNYDNSSSMLSFYSRGYKPGKSYKTQMYTACKVSLLNTNVTFFIPNDNYTIDDLINNNVIDDFNKIEYIISSDEAKENYFTSVHFPEFKCESSRDVKEIIKEDFHINSMFLDSAFSRLSKSNIFASGIYQVAKLDLNKKGIEASSVIYIPGAGASGPNEYENVYEDIYINKPFLFNITKSSSTIKKPITIFDEETNLEKEVFKYLNYDISLFSGVINSL